MPNLVNSYLQVIDFGNGLACGHSVEIGFIDTFYSSRQPDLGNIIVRDSRLDGNVFRAQVAYCDQIFSLANQLNERSVALNLTPVTDLWLMDAVLRFVFSSADIAAVVIGDRRLTHMRKNRYHQYDMQAVRLVTTDGREITLHGTTGSLPRGFKPVVYARDEHGKWIIHFRVIAAEPERVIVKGCHRLYNKAFPKWIQNLCQWTGLSSRLLYLRERYSQRIPFQSNGAATVSLGQDIRISCSWNIGS